MRKIYLAFILFFSLLCSYKADAACPAPGTYSIGPTGTYTSITAAVADLTLCGSISGSYIFELQATYVSTVETFPITIGNLGTTATKTITFRPATGATNRIITTNNDLGTIILNGAQYIFLDGRAGGIGSTRNLTIQNTSTTVVATTASGIITTSSFTFNVADASQFAIGMSLGVGVGAGTGVFASGTLITGIAGNTITINRAPTIQIPSGAAIMGSYMPGALIFQNDALHNSVSYCNLISACPYSSTGTVTFKNAIAIGNNENKIDRCEIYAGVTTPQISILADGTTGLPNIKDTISNCLIHDFFSASGSPSGILLKTISDWVISGNSIYQTAARSLSSASIQFNGINIANVNLGNNNLITNNYIGGGAANAGGTSLTLTGSGQFAGIVANVGTTTSTAISNNTIQNISFTSTGTSANFRAMNLAIGSFNCTNNIIGSTSVANSLVLAMTSAGTAGTPTAASLIVGSSPSPAIVNISNNTISNISHNTGGVTYAFNVFRGIGMSGAATSFTVSNNLITNISSNADIPVRGIFSSSTAATNTISSNTISNISNSSSGTSASVNGIFTQGTGNFTITNNNIFNLQSASALPASVGAVAAYMQTSGSNNIFSKNIIYGLTNTAANSTISGFNTTSGGWIVSNNMISLTNGSNTNSIAIGGISDASGAAGARNYYHNSVYIGGNGANDNAAISSAALLYNCGAGSSIIRNNILVMERNGSTGHFYTIANNTATTSGLTTSNNILNNSTAGSVGLSGTTFGTNDKTFAAWQSIYGETGSYTAQYVPFVNTTIGNLHIDMADLTLAASAFVSKIESSGSTLTGITDDIDGDNRPGPVSSLLGGASAPDLGADEVDLALTANNIWTGAVSTDWTNAGNWSVGVPTNATDAIIPVVASSRYPNIINNVPVTKNLSIMSGASVTISNTGSLSIAGSFTEGGTLTNNGELIFNGSSAQTFSGTGTISAMNNFTVNNTSGGLTVARSFSLTGKLTPTSGNINLNNSTITLRSTSAATASVASVGGSFSYTGSGKFIIERYIPARLAWRLLTSPVTAASGQTTNAAWQEGATPKWPMGAEPVTSIYNPNPGYGTHISGGTSAVNGFDANTTGNPSMKYLSGGAWVGTTSTYSTKVTDHQGYMLFVRGSRALDLTPGTAITPTNTTLRSSGQLKVGTINVATSGLTIVGNPYASAIDFHKVALASGLSSDTYYLWDPALTGTNNVGAWVAFSWNGSSYDRTIPDTATAPALGGPVYGGSITFNGIIESGAAFFVNNTGTLVFNENAKTNGVNNAMFRPTQVKVNLLAKNNDGTISANDGILVTYGDAYSNAVDDKDAIKMVNFSENFSSKREGKLLSIERRKTINETDTIFFNLENVQLKTYLFEIKTDSLIRNNLAAFLEDNFLHTSTPVSLKNTNRFEFKITANASSYKDRFRLVFKPSVKINNISAELINKNIVLNWAVDSNYNLNEYIVERSTDSSHFLPINYQQIENNTNQSVVNNFIDNDVATGKEYYYRIMYISKAGVITYSEVAKVTVYKNSSAVYVFPNPVNNNRIGIHFPDKEYGVYHLSLTDNKGAEVNSRSILHTENVPEYFVPGKKLSPAIYLLHVTNPDGSKTSIKVLIM